VISYLASRPSRDIVVAAHQELTRQWWDQRRKDYHLVVSDVVLREAADGDSEAAERRSTILAGIDVLEVGEAALELAEKLIHRRAVPAVAAEDALHIAIAVTNGVAPTLQTQQCAVRSTMSVSSRATNQRCCARPKSSARSNPMWKDPIVEEVRKIRQLHAKRFNYDLRAIVNDLRKQQEQSGRKYVRFEPRRPSEGAKRKVG